MTQLPTDLARRGYNSEVANERNNYRRAIEEVAATAASLAARADKQIDPTVVGALRNLVIEVTEAYQRAAAWHALARVEFVLPEQED